MKIAYVVEAYETFIVDEILELRRQGVGVTVFDAFRSPIEHDPVKEEIRGAAYYFPRAYRGVIPANARALASHPAAYLAMPRRLSGGRSSVRKIVLGAYLASLVEKLSIDHVHATFGTRTATLASVIARLSGRPFSFTTHAYDIMRPNPSLVWKTREAAFVRTISEFNRRFIAEHYPDAPLSKVVVNYLGIDLKKFAPVPRRPGPRVRVVTVGRLVYTKGHAILIAACATIARAGHAVSCRIVGEGEERAALEQEIDRRDLRSIVDLSGSLTHDAVRHVLGDTDLFVLACMREKEGEDQDGIPVALMEAMAMGVPVISTSLSGIPELIEDGISGLLVPPGDEGALAAAIERVVTDPALRARLGAAGRCRIEERFDLAANTSRLIAMFAATLPGHGAPGHAAGSDR